MTGDQPIDLDKQPEAMAACEACPLNNRRSRFIEGEMTCKLPSHGPDSRPYKPSGSLSERAAALAFTCKLHRTSLLYRLQTRIRATLGKTVIDHFTADHQTEETGSGISDNSTYLPELGLGETEVHQLV